MLSSVYHLLFTDSEDIDKGLLLTHVCWFITFTVLVFSL